MYKSRSGKTWIESEEYAYNTYSGAHSRSERRGRAIYPDGYVRSVTLGVPDTFFSIPAHGRMNGKYVSGFVSNSDGEFEFTVSKRAR